MEQCTHEDFKADVKVNRITDKWKFAADVRIECSQCGRRFSFMGLPGGVNLDWPTCSPFGLEARLPIEPTKDGIPDLRRESQ